MTHNDLLRLLVEAVTQKLMLQLIVGGQSIAVRVQKVKYPSGSGEVSRAIIERATGKTESAMFAESEFPFFEVHGLKPGSRVGTDRLTAFVAAEKVDAVVLD